MKIIFLLSFLASYSTMSEEKVKVKVKSISLENLRISLPKDDLRGHSKKEKSLDTINYADSLAGILYLAGSALATGK